MLGEGVDEDVEGLAFSWLALKALSGIERNDVHVALRVQRLEQLSQVVGHVWGVVAAMNEGPLERDAPPCGRNVVLCVWGGVVYVRIHVGR